MALLAVGKLVMLEKSIRVKLVEEGRGEYRGRKRGRMESKMHCISNSMVSPHNDDVPACRSSCI